MSQLRTAEFVSPKHPDKICDYIADTILDNYLAIDPQARVAVEVMGGHGLITLNGEVTSSANIDCTRIVQNIVGAEYKVITNIAQQSPEIARGVDVGGAGDQGIMVGFATSATPNFVPVEYQLARSLCQQIYKVYPYDGKVQVTVDVSFISAPQVKCVVASFQNSKSKELEELVRSLITAGKYLINPAGEWQQGGFDADSGLSGRKLVVDAYGPSVAIGGGSFSGKDATKVDRSGAYYARKVAVDLLNKLSQGHANAETIPTTEVIVKIAYAIGVVEPVMAVAFINGVEQDISTQYDFSPSTICNLLELNKPQFAELCQWGHFGRDNIWDKQF